MSMPNKSALSIGLVASVFAFAFGYRFSNSNFGPDNATTVAAGSSAGVADGWSIDAAANADRPYQQRDRKAAKQNSNVETTAVAQVQSHRQADVQQKAVQDSPYLQYESDVQKNLPPPAWFYTTRDVYAEVAAADPSAVVDKIACGDATCRVEVRHASEKARDRFANSISGPMNVAPGARQEDAQRSSAESTSRAERADMFVSTGIVSTASVATAYDYPEDDPNATIVYLLKTDSPDEILAKLQAKMQENPRE